MHNMTASDPRRSRAVFATAARWRFRLKAGMGLCTLTSAFLAGPAIAQEAAAETQEKRDFSQAEVQLLMTDQLSKLKLPTALNYRFTRRGTLEPAFEDSVSVQVKRKAAGGCCEADAKFLNGERKVTLPAIDDAQGNPVTLYFLEHDIREMKRITKGSTTYFRKRVRMAIYSGASIEPVQFTYRDKPVAGKQIVVEPYRDDPNRARFENMVRKQYVFTLSDAVPGVVAAIRTIVPTANAAEPLMADEMILEGVQPPPMPAPAAIAPAGAASNPSPTSPSAQKGASSAR